MVQSLIYLLLLTVSVGNSSSENGWSMSSPHTVTGREGKSVILPCKFTHPNTGYNGKIKVIWKINRFYEGPPIFSCTSVGQLQNCISQNVIGQSGEERYRLTGDPRKNDASIMIQNLRKNDTNKYFCRVEFDLKGKQYECKAGTSLQVTEADPNSWSVSDTEGGSVTLPCSFNLTHNNPHYIAVIWTKGNPYEQEGQVVFNHSTKLNSTNRNDRFELCGNLIKGNASIRVRDLRVNDTGKYFCHVEYSHGNRESETFVTEDVIYLHVLEPKSVIAMWAIVPPLLMGLMILITVTCVIWRRKGFCTGLLQARRRSRRPRGSYATSEKVRDTPLPPSGQGSEHVYSDVVRGRWPNGIDKVSSEACTYADIVFTSRQVLDGRDRAVDFSDSDVTYAAVVIH